jgi:hydroxymethylpyrimidine pyrophosphatase-like HAD family hydrolase
MFLPDIVEATGMEGLAICANGAMLLDLATMRPESVVSFPPGEGLAVAAELDVAASAGELRVMLTRDGEHVRLIGGGEQFRAEVAGLVAQRWEIFKLAARAPEGVPGVQFLDDVRRRLQGRAQTTVSAPGTTLVELAPTGVDKSVALAAYAGLTGIARADVHAVGDMPNDLEMIAWAGHGYAVANAHAQVLDAADEVLPANDDDGVAVLLERLASRG